MSSISTSFSVICSTKLCQSFSDCRKSASCTVVTVSIHGFRNDTSSSRNLLDVHSSSVRQGRSSRITSATAPLLHAHQSGRSPACCNIHIDTHVGRTEAKPAVHNNAQQRPSDMPSNLCHIRPQEQYSRCYVIWQWGHSRFSHCLSLFALRSARKSRVFSWMVSSE